MREKDLCWEAAGTLGLGVDELILVVPFYALRSEYPLAPSPFHNSFELLQCDHSCVGREVEPAGFSS